MISNRSEQNSFLSWVYYMTWQLVGKKNYIWKPNEKKNHVFFVFILLVVKEEAKVNQHPMV